MEEEEEKKEEPAADAKDDKDKMERGNWLALESNPAPLNKFATRMGLPGDYAFCDIYGLDAELLQFVPKPVLAVMLLFPSSKKINEFKAKQMETLTKSPQKMNKDLFYLHQHDDIGNACGTIAMIHALTNNHVAKNFVLKDSALTKFMEDSKEMDWSERGWALLKAKDIQEGSQQAAKDKGPDGNQTDVDKTEVNAHFITFIRKDNELWEMDGRKKFPVSHGKTSGGSFLGDVAKVVKEKFMEVDPDNVNFNLMALAAAQQ